MLWLTLARAADPATDWGTLYDARLVEIADGSPENAVKLYAALGEDRQPSDPLYALTAYWLGRAELETGQVEAALQSLNAAAADPTFRDAALTLLEEADLRVSTVATLPGRWDFESGGFPAVRGAAGNSRGDSGPAPAGGRNLFSWETTVRPGEPDRLTLRFGPEAALKEFAFVARAVTAQAVLRLVALDEWGARWVSAEVPVGADWTPVKVNTASFVPEFGLPGPLQIGRVVDLSIEDITGERSDVRGANTLLLDDVVAL